MLNICCFIFYYSTFCVYNVGFYCGFWSEKSDRWIFFFTSFQLWGHVWANTSLATRKFECCLTVAPQKEVNLWKWRAPLVDWGTDICKKKKTSSFFHSLQLQRQTSPEASCVYLSSGKAAKLGGELLRGPLCHPDTRPVQNGNTCGKIYILSFMIPNCIYLFIYIFLLPVTYI